MRGEVKALAREVRRKRGIITCPVLGSVEARQPGGRSALAVGAVATGGVHVRSPVRSLT